MAHPGRMGAGRPLAAAGLAALLAAAFLLAGVLPPVRETCAASGPRDSCGHDAADAAAAAEAIIRRHAAGGDAGFREETVSRTGDTWTVTGYTETRDDAGGMLYRDFTVIFTCTGGGQYRVDLCRVG